MSVGFLVHSSALAKCIGMDSLLVTVSVSMFLVAFFVHLFASLLHGRLCYTWLTHSVQLLLQLVLKFCLFFLAIEAVLQLN